MNLTFKFSLPQKINFLDVLAGAYILWLNNGFFTYVFIDFPFYFFQLLFFAWFFVAILNEKKFFAKLIASEILPVYFLLLILFYGLMHTYVFLDVTRSACIILIEIVAISTYYFNKRRSGFLRYICFLLLVDDFFIILRTLYYLRSDPYLSRMLHFKIDALSKRVFTSGVTIKSAALIDYPIAYALIFVAIYLFYLWRIKKNSFYLVLSLLMIFVEIKVGLFIAVILTVVSYMVYCMLDSKRRVALIIGTIILFILSFSLLPDILEFIAARASAIYAAKLLEIRDFLLDFSVGAFGEGDLNTRLQLYLNSVKSFFKYPFFGVLFTGKELSNDILGGHSTILDFAAGFGLLIVPFYFFWIKKFNSIKYVRDDAKRNVLFTAYIVYFLMGLVNTSFSGRILMYVLFVLPALLFKEECRQRNINII